MIYRIKLTVQAVSGASYFGYPIYLSLWLDDSQKADGITVKASSPSQWTSAITWISDELTVTDKTNGTTTLKIRVYSGSGSSRDETYTFSLNISPAASALGTISAFELGSQIDVPITKYAGYYDVLTVKYGSTTIAAYNDSSAAGGASITVDTDTDAFFVALKNAQSGNFTFSLSTYTVVDGVLLGTSIKTVKGSVPANIKPTADVTISQQSSNTWLTGKGFYVKGYSKISAQISNRQAGRGASVRSSSFVYEDQEIIGTSYVTPVIKNAGELTIICRVTDTRSRITDYSEKITILDYAPPAVQSIAYERGTYADGEWSADEDGSAIAATIKVQYTLIAQGNEVTIKASVDGSVSSAITSAASDTEYVMYLLDIDGEVEHELTVTATDSLGASGERSISVMSSAVNGYDVLKGGKGISFGKVAELEETLDSAWHGLFRSGMTITGGLRLDGNIIADQVVENGVSDIWSYEKWLSGMCICRCVKDYGKVDIDVASGSLYIGNTIDTVDFPFEFTDPPNIAAIPMTTAFAFFGPTADVTVAQIPAVTLMRPSARTGVAVKIAYTVIGNIDTSKE